jgi:RimJ/RimL family protein N-acetyltransferase
MTSRTLCIADFPKVLPQDDESYAIDRTFEPERVRRLAVDPAIFRYIADDFFPSPMGWHPNMQDFVVNLIATDWKDDFGFGIFIPDTHTCYKSHIGFLPRSYGPKALESFKAMIQWMWDHTLAARLVGEVCVENRRAIQFALRAGFTRYGFNEKSVLRRGILRDQVCLGISKP